MESTAAPTDADRFSSAALRLHCVAPVAAATPKIDEALPPGRPPPPPAASKRGPTKVRLLPVPESLYRTIEHGARESGMTIAAYLNALIEIARAAVGDDANERPAASGSTARAE